jgi:hypothetical protein
MRQSAQRLLSARLRPSFVTVDADQALDRLQIRWRLPSPHISQQVMLEDLLVLSANAGKVQLGFDRRCREFQCGRRHIVADELVGEFPDLRAVHTGAENRTGKPVTQRVAAGTGLALSGDGARAPESVSAVGRDLLFRGHDRDPQ